MATLASTKDLSRAISAFIQSPTLPLPDELNQVIEGYLEKHERYDEGAADRLNDELVAIYQKSVQDRPDRYAPFLAILRPLRAAVRSPVLVLQWWDRLAGPVLDNLGHHKGLAKQALDNALGLLVYNDGDEDADNPANPYADRLFQLWIGAFQARQHDHPVADHFKADLLHETLFSFGKKMPKSFMTAIDKYVVRREFRARFLTLLCQFLSTRPPHLYLVLQTPLFGSILQSLQEDTSTTVVSLALSALIMFLPNVPSSLVPYLPSLFNIYARLLFWDRERSLIPEDANGDDESEKPSSNSAWDRCLYSPDLDGRSQTIRHLSSYFTMLYGLYPINFVDYIRKPQRYLRHANTAEDVEVQPTEIRDRSERFRRTHVLHPNFYNLTIESEKTDFGRWIKADAAEVIATCMALRQPAEQGSRRRSSATQPDADERVEVHRPERESSEHALLDGADNTGGKDASTAAVRYSSSTTAESSLGSVDKRATARVRKNSQSSHQSLTNSHDARSGVAMDDSPTIPPSLGGGGSHTQLQDMIQSNKAIKSSLHQSLTNDSVPSLALSHQESIHEKASIKPQLVPESLLSIPPAGDNGAQVSQLHRQILMLQNDLNFERYMKEQHLSHIGELQRKQLVEAQTEAETQNLVEANRQLTKRLDEARKSEMQAKKEADNRRAMATKWESELSGKLRGLREEQKKWNAEGANLRRELDAARDKYDRLRRLVAEAEDKELKSKQLAQSNDTNVDEMEKLRAEVERLSVVERDYQGREMSMTTAINEAAEASSRAEMLAIELRARDAELSQARNLYESQIAELNNKLTEAVREGSGRKSADAANMSDLVDKSLTASRAKQAELQKKYSLLMRKYNVLQSSLSGMASAHSPPQSRGRDELGGSGGGGGLQDVDGDAAAAADAALTPVTVVRTRSHRGFSDPEILETSFNVTPPLEAISPSVGAAFQRPSTPSGSGGTGPDGSAGARSPPQGERYYGRGKGPLYERGTGGVQNAIRKDKKDKKQESEKERKTSGIRGIRGFV